MCEQTELFPSSFGKLEVGDKFTDKSGENIYQIVSYWSMTFKGWLLVRNSQTHKWVEVCRQFEDKHGDVEDQMRNTITKLKLEKINENTNH